MAGQAPRTLGFLFADLRGYSAFVEAHGDDAGAQLLRAYRDLVREQVASFDGAEIRTEGDSFYAVFPSASSAVRCGMAILEAAAASTAAGGGPIRVGIGVHAGETTETDEGYVGSVVNIAARVCSAARPNELLVTDTVRSIVRTRSPLHFTPRGSRRLKGIQEPVRLYRAEQTIAAAASVGTTARWALGDWLRRQPAMLGITAAAAILLVAGAAAVGALFGSEPSRSPAAQPLIEGTEPGRSPVATPTEGLSSFPDEAEAELLLTVPADLRSRCRRGDGPRPSDLVMGRPYGTAAGLRCTAPGPTVIDYWVITSDAGYVGPGEGSQAAIAAFVSYQGRHALPEGDCASAIEAHGRWEFGPARGRILCYQVESGARLVWTYDGTDIIAIATRSDGDAAALYQWWLANGRTTPTED